MTGNADHQPQPDQRPGEVLAGDDGRWNAAALRRLAALGDAPVIWLPGKLAHVATIGGKSVGHVRRQRPEQPWVIRIEGFEFWHAPTRVITRWHYTPVTGIKSLVQAKRELKRIIATRPAAPEL